MNKRGCTFFHCKIWPCFLMFFVLVCTVALSLEVWAADWQLYTNSQFNFRSLSFGVPEETKLENAEMSKVIFHIGFLDDGTNGAVEVTRLKNGSLRNYSVIREASEIRKGMEQSPKSKVLYQKEVLQNGLQGIEFRTQTLTSKGTIWYGIQRLFVSGDAMYTIYIAAPTKARLEEKEIQRFLQSFSTIH